MYELRDDGKTLWVKPLEEQFTLDEWYDKPLELCSRIVQEDLIVMQEECDEPLSSGKLAEVVLAGQRGKNGNKTEKTEYEYTPNSKPYIMSAASVVFSFSGLPQKLGKPVEFLHAPVPGYEEFLRRSINHTLTNLQPNSPVWRNNWSISSSGVLDKPLDAITGSEASLSGDMSAEEVATKYLWVEYQTLRRLPRTGGILFTVKMMVDPLGSLLILPQRQVATKCLAASIRGMSNGMRSYKGIGDTKALHSVLNFLDEISSDSS